MARLLTVQNSLDFSPFITISSIVFNLLISKLILFYETKLDWLGTVKNKCCVVQIFYSLLKFMFLVNTFLVNIF